MDSIDGADEQQDITGHASTKITSKNVNAALDEDTFEENRKAVYVSEAEAAKRMNLRISVEDPAWIQTHEMFKRLLDGKELSYQQILTENFTMHESRMLSPPDRVDLERLQRQNTKRFQKLLKTQFKGLQPNDATKLTMLYFGLPVEPLANPLDELDGSMQKRGSEGALYDVQPPLHFLSAHNKRNWGKPELEGEEGLSYPLPLSAPKESKMSVDSESEDESTGGSIETDSEWEEYYSETSLWKPVRLYGYQGAIDFSRQDIQKTLEAALYKLLSLTPGSCARFTLLQFSKRTGLPTTQRMDGRLPLNEQTELLNWITLQCSPPVSPNEEWHACFVKLRSDSSPDECIPFGRSGTEVAELYYSPDNHVDRRGNKLKSYAYVSKPEKVSVSTISAWGSNDCMPHIQAALNVVLGRPENGQRYHRAFIRLCNTNRYRVAAPFIYGLANVRPIDFVTLHYSKSHFGVPIDVETLEEDEIPVVLPHYYPDYVPGQRLSFKAEINDEDGSATFAGAMKVIREICRDFVRGAPVFRYVVATVVSHPDEHMPMYSPMLTILPLGENLDERAKKNLELGQKEFISYLKERFSESEHPVVILHPFWEAGQQMLCVAEEKPEKNAPRWQPGDPIPCISEEELLKPDEEPAEKDEAMVEMPPIGEDLEQFRNCLMGLWLQAQSKKNKEEVLDFPKECVVRLRPRWADQSFNWRPSVEFSSSFLGPDTTEEEFREIRLALTGDRVYVDFLTDQETSWRRATRSSVFGPRYELAYQDSPQSSESSDAESLHEEDMELQQPKAVHNSPDRRHGPQETIPRPGTGPEMDSQSDGSSDPSEENLASRRVEEASVTKSRPHQIDDDRTRTWAHQPSIFEPTNRRTQSSQFLPRIPINAPPVEHVFRTSPNCTMISKSVMTPQEQLQMSKSFAEMRSTALSRTATCMYEGCGFQYRLDEHEAAQNHLRLKHLARKCMWCDEALFEYWDQEQRDRHLRTKHKTDLMRALKASTAQMNPITGGQTYRIPADYTTLPQSQGSARLNHRNDTDGSGRRKETTIRPVLPASLDNEDMVMEDASALEQPDEVLVETQLESGNLQENNSVVQEHHAEVTIEGQLAEEETVAEIEAPTEPLSQTKTIPKGASKEPTKLRTPAEKTAARKAAAAKGLITRRANQAARAAKAMGGQVPSAGAAAGPGSSADTEPKRRAPKTAPKTTPKPKTATKIDSSEAKGNKRKRPAETEELPFEEYNNEEQPDLEKYEYKVDESGKKRRRRRRAEEDGTYEQGSESSDSDDGPEPDVDEADVLKTSPTEPVRPKPKPSTTPNKGKGGRARKPKTAEELAKEAEKAADKAFVTADGDEDDGLRDHDAGEGRAGDDSGRPMKKAKTGPTSSKATKVPPPIKQTPPKKTAAKKTPVKKTPAKKTPIKKTPAKKAPAKKTPTKKTAD